MQESSRGISQTLARMLGARTALLLASSASEVGEVLAAWAHVRPMRPLDGCPVACADVRALGERAREEGMPLLIDASICGPDGCAAVRLGAHVALVGLADDTCVAALSRDCERGLPGVTRLLGDMPQVGESDLERVGKLAQRRAASWRASSDAAQVVANYLRCHPRIEAVRYPGLKGDPSFATAARTLEHGFGPVMDVRLLGCDDWERVICTDGDPREQVLELERCLSRGGIDVGGATA